MQNISSPFSLSLSLSHSLFLSHTQTSFIPPSTHISNLLTLANTHTSCDLGPNTWPHSSTISDHILPTKQLKYNTLQPSIRSQTFSPNPYPETPFSTCEDYSWDGRSLRGSVGHQSQSRIPGTRSKLRRNPKGSEARLQHPNLDLRLFYEDCTRETKDTNHYEQNRQRRKTKTS